MIVGRDNKSVSADQYTQRIDHHGPHQPQDEQPNPKPMVTGPDSREGSTMTLCDDSF